MNKKQVFYFLFFGILVIGFFIVLIIVIPGFAKPRFPAIGAVRSFSFVNQDNKPITDKDIQDKVVAVEYFFTTCKGICPRLNNNMKKVYEEFINENDFLILSHTCDPETDSVEQLKRYSYSMQVDSKRWQFLTGPKDSLYFMARESYKIDDPHNNPQKIEDDFLHTQFIALVDKNSNVVKIYDGLKQSELNEMSKQIKRLLKE
jgi:protein SCO1/2